ncbi:MAG: tRNA lysidine(34) synthetase TilS [Deltaproteobacteria bacterium]|nr:tRNA lysidine(34) synthetase TilS [Deltaproteobacteria bacterium]
METPSLVEVLSEFFGEIPPIESGEPIVIGFSGGADSTALLAGLRSLSSSLGFEPIAAHLDHGLDSDSQQRAQRARQLSDSLRTRFCSERRRVDQHRHAGESLEEAARRIRYAFLEEVRLRTGSRFVATAHHCDDQAETVSLRIAFGTGLRGLAAIRPIQGCLLRPLLEMRRQSLLQFLESRGMSPIVDPSNFDRQFSRNRFRHDVLPHLERDEPYLTNRLAALASAAQGARRQLDQRLATHLRPKKSDDGSLSIPLRTFQLLPSEVRSLALAWLHEQAGLSYPASRQAGAELERQLTRGGNIGCDCGAGWRWERHSQELVLRRQPTKTPFFTYTFAVPGVQDIPELGLRLELRRMRESVPLTSSHPIDWQRGVGAPSGAPWQTLQATLALPLRPGQTVTVRNRLPGDRVRPSGRRSLVRLKEILIDRHIPRMERDRLPLLCVGDQIAWVPSVTVDERFRPAGLSINWLAEITRP